MACDDVRDALLSCESPKIGALPLPLREHLEQCPACCEYLDQIAGVERLWREQPMPPGCDDAKSRFLTKIETTTSPARPTGGSKRGLPRWRWMVAASILGFAITGAWLAMPSPDVNAQDVLDRLVDWNLAIAHSPDDYPPELISQEREDLRKIVESTPMNDDDRALAVSMLDTGPFLARNKDPLAAAGRFERIAEQMHKRVDKAATKGDSPAFGRWGNRFGAISERGIKPQLDFAKKMELHLKQKQEWDNLQMANRKRQEAIARMAERHPEFNRPEMHRPPYGRPPFGGPPFGGPPHGIPGKKGFKGKS